MDPTIESRFKTLFEKEMQQLLYSHGVIDENFHIQKDDFFDLTDLSTAELEQSMRMRLRNREAIYLRKITDALRRLKNHTFGVCEGCGDQIDLRRLEARPTTTHCVACKEEQEHREHLHADGLVSKSIGKKVFIV